MKKKLLVLIAVLISFPFVGEMYSMQRVETVDVAQEKCYTTSRSQGIRKFNAKSYSEALVLFNQANACPDKPEKNDLESWINKCKDRLKTDGNVVLEPNRVDLPMEGGVVTVQVKTDAAEYFIENLPKWIQVEKYPGYFKMNIPANSTGEEKAIELEIRVGDRVLLFPVAQESRFSKGKRGGELIPVTPILVGREIVPIDTVPLQISESEILFPVQGGSKMVEVTTHDLFYAVSGIPKWIQVKISDYYIVVSCLENTTGKVREREIYVVTEDERLPLFVRQEAPLIKNE